MLRTLELRDFAIVDELELEFEPGFNALTGETGAGKSILVDALSLLIGGRAETTLIRAGSDSALVQGRFDGAGFTTAARRLARNGRHSARLDGELITVAELAERGNEGVAIFGQHAATDLTRGSHQRRQLDRLLEPDAVRTLKQHRQRFRRFREVDARLQTSRADERERARLLDMLSFQIGEIDDADLSPGEDERLQSELGALRNAERIREGASRAFELLADDDGAVGRAAEGLRDLSGAGRFEPTLAALARDLDQAVSSLQAVASEVEAFLADVDTDPGRLDHVETRLARIEALKRKYGDSIVAVLAFRDDARLEQDRLAHVDEDVRDLEAESQRLVEELVASSTALSAARRRAADALEEQIRPYLVALGMPSGRFEVELRVDEHPGEMGADLVRFLFVAHPGEPLAPLSDVASGGELSRIMLALHLVTGSDLPVLVFDEIDAGIGGKTAHAVGTLLKRLSAQHQVLVVTHLPQVAAFADAQFAVTKDESVDRTVTRVARLDHRARIDELARMLSGRVTDVSRRHAEELLEQTGAAPNAG